MSATLNSPSYKKNFPIKSVVFHDLSDKSKYYGAVSKGFAHSPKVTGGLALCFLVLAFAMHAARTEHQHKIMRLAASVDSSAAASTAAVTSTVAAMTGSTVAATPTAAPTATTSGSSTAPTSAPASQSSTGMTAYSSKFISFSQSNAGRNTMISFYVVGSAMALLSWQLYRENSVSK